MEAQEGGHVWGKGVTSGNDDDVMTCEDTQTLPCGGGNCHGMPVSSVHLMTVNLQVRDTPLGYAPPVGPPVRFTVRYNHRGAGRNVLGQNWTDDWISWITDSPQSPLADVKYHPGGGGARTFTGFDPNTQTFAYQQYDQTLLRRTGPDSYELVWPDGSKKVFAKPDGSVGSTRKVYLTQIADPAGNALTLSYNGEMEVTAITDALGQTTTLSYGEITNSPPPCPCIDVDANDFGTGVRFFFALTNVTDPFGRSATFHYSLQNAGCPRIKMVLNGIPVVTDDACCSNTFLSLDSITDVQGLTSHFTYDSRGAYSSVSAVMTSMTTPYGTTTFSTDNGSNPSYRFVETTYPDGSRERVEFNQSTNLGIPFSLPSSSVPQGMSTWNQWRYTRNTYYWSREACALAYGDYTKARIYHWLHEPNMTTTSARSAN